MLPVLRPWPSGSLRECEGGHLLVGHGAPVHGSEAATGLKRSYELSRRDIPRAVISMVKSGR